MPKHTTITITDKALGLLPPGRSMSHRINRAILKAALAVEPFPSYEADGLKVWRTRVQDDGSALRLVVVATATSVDAARALARHLTATGFDLLELRMGSLPARRE